MTEIAETDRIEAFLQGSPFAVLGASAKREKYGNKVLRCYVQNGRRVHAINPREHEVEGVRCYRRLAEVPEQIHAISVVTPPAAALSIVQQAESLGIRHVWFQPGAASQEAVRHGQAAGMNIIADGSCLLVVLGYRE